MPTVVKKKKICPDITAFGQGIAFTGGVTRLLRALIFPVLCLYCITPAVVTAETGDRMYVKFPIVNLRSGPDITYPIVLKLSKGRALIEVERQGNWVLVATGRRDVKSGWLYANLLSPYKEGKKPEAPTEAGTPAAPAKTEKPTGQAGDIKKQPPAKPDPDGPLFVLFQQAFSELNAKFKTNTGKDCFRKIDNPVHGVVQLTVNDEWADLTHEQRQKTMSDIFAIWNAAQGESVPITVDIIDKEGIRLMSKFRN